METNMKVLAKAKWDQVETQVVNRIRLLKAMAQNIEQNEVTDRVANDLVLPAVALLGEFCRMVTPDMEVHPTCIWSPVADSTDYHAGCSGTVISYMPRDYVNGDWEYCMRCGRRIEFREDGR